MNDPVVSDIYQYYRDAYEYSETEMIEHFASELINGETVQINGRYCSMTDVIQWSTILEEKIIALCRARTQSEIMSATADFRQDIEGECLEFVAEKMKQT